MIRPSTIVWLLLVVAVGYAMFQVKYEVMQQEATLASLNKDIADGREQIRVLDAEWSYLSQPSRIEELSNRFLDLSGISAAAIVELSAVPERAGAPPALASAHHSTPTVQAGPSLTAAIAMSARP